MAVVCMWQCAWQTAHTISPLGQVAGTLPDIVHADVLRATLPSLPPFGTLPDIVVSGIDEGTSSSGMPEMVEPEHIYYFERVVK